MAGTDLKPVRENVLPSLKPVDVAPMVPVSRTPRAYDLSVERKNDIIPLPTPNSDSSGFTKIVSSQDLYENRQYDSYDPEKSPDFYAYGQSTTDKALNGLVKFAGKTATTIASNTAGLVYGLGAWAADGKFSSFYDNDFFRSMDAIDEKLRISNPHLYTQAEIDDPFSANSIFSGNFLWDKIVSNLGYAAGAAVTGYAATAAMEALGLSRALVAAGKGLQALEASNAAVAEGRSMASMLSNLRKASGFDKLAGGLGGALEGAGTVSAGAKFSKGAQLAGSFLGSTGESGMESFQAKKQALATGLDMFRQTHGGREPNEDEMSQLVDTADRIGNATFGLNMALLTTTNNIQLPKIFGSTFSGEKATLNNIIFKNNTWASTLPQKGFGKMLYGAYKGTSLLFNPAEAFEEGMQYAIEKGTSNYFSRSDYNKEDSWFSDLGALLLPGGRGVLGKGVADTLTSNEGLESILIGGLSGAMMTSGIFTAGRTGDIAERGVFGYGGAEGKLRNETIAAWNKVPFVEKLKEMKEFIDRSEMTQIMRDQAIRVGDILEAKDLESDYMLGYMLPRIKYGGKDAIMEEVKSVREQALTTDGFQKLIEAGYANENDGPENFLARLSNIENTANLVDKSYAQLNGKLSGEILKDEDGNPVLDSDKQPIRKYSNQLVNKLVYSTAKIADYTDRINTLQDTLGKNGVVISDIVEAINNDATPEEVTEAIDKQADKIIGIVNGSDLLKTDLLTNLQDASELQMRKKAAIKEQNEMLSAPESFADRAPEVEPEGKVESKVLVKTKDGEEQLEVGTEYYLGKVTEKDNKNNEVYRFPRLTILGENEDGTIKIQTSNGRIRDISKDDLSDYKLGKVSDVEKNPNANFYLRNINKVAYWNRGKAKGGKKQGRLIYDSKADKLQFVYTVSKGKTSTIDISQESFQPNEGFKEGIFSFGGELTAEDTADYNKAKKSGQLQKNLETVLANRGEVIEALYDEASDNLAKTKELIASRTEQLEKTQAELKDAQDKVNNPEYTKAKKFKAVTKTAIKAVKSLSKIQDSLILEIQSLENELEQTEINLEYINELYNKLDEYPTASNEFFDELKKERDEIEYLVEETKENISVLQSLLKDVQGALDVAVEFVRDIIDKFATKYPDLPFGQNELRDFLNKNIEDTNRQKDITPTSEAEKMLPYTAVSAGLLDDLATFDREIADLDDIEIIPREKQIDEINAEISKAVDKLFQLKKQLKAKDEVLSRFKKIADEYIKRKTREDKLRTDEKLIAQVLGTQGKDIENSNPSDKTYQPDPKKSWLQAVLSTVIPSKKTAGGELKAHQLRANEFAYRMSPDAIKDLRAVVVTTKNQAKLGLPTLMEDGVAGTDFKADAVIAVVITDKKGRPVGLNGKPLNKPSFDNAIFQTMPTAENLPNLFREGTPKTTIDALVAEYKVWRTEQFANEDVIPIGFVTSFGIPEYVEVLSEDGKSSTRDFSATVPVVASGLITDNDLNNKQTMYVHVSDTPAEKGTTKFNNALGRVFLNLAKGYIKLNARKYNSKEADTIFEGIKFLSNNMFEKGTIRDEQSKRVISWLRSVAYWGKPKEKAGYNSIWFEKVEVPGTGLSELRLFMSGKDGSFSFDPDSLQANKDSIITLLEKMYFNTNARRVNDPKIITQPYEEIIGFKNGQIVTRDVSKDFPESQAGKWPNYQTYLLSSKGREANDIPFTTNIRPLKGDDDVNIVGHYFTLTGNKAQFETAVANKPVVTAQPVIIAPANTLQITPAPATPVQKLPQVGATPSTGIIRDGITPNPIEIKLPNGTIVGTINYTTNENNELAFNSNDQVIEDLAIAMKISLEESERAVWGKILTTLNQAFPVQTAATFTPTTPYGTPVGEPIVVAAAPVVAQANVVAVQPVPDSSVKSAEEIMAQMRKGGVDNTAMRQIIGNQLKAFKPENWNEVEAWLKDKFGNVPVYRVKNVLRSTNGRQSWGMFSDGAIYIYADAEIGTVYHEVFHAVWRMFADPKEVQDVINEFKGRSGSFTDRNTGKDVKYSEATADQIEEELAEEFRDFVNKGKRPVKNQSGMSFIARLFDDLVSFIKEFFTGPKSRSNTETLFNKIGGGYFNQFTPFNNELAYSQKGLIDIEQVIVPDGAALRSMFSSGNINDAVQHMLYRSVTDLVNRNADIANASDPKNKAQLYQYLRDDLDRRILLSGIAAQDGLANKTLTQEQADSMYGKALALHDELMNNDETWENIIEQYEEKITAYNISFDENNELMLNDEDKSGKGEYHNANQIDLFKTANSQVKLLLASIPYPDPNKPGDFKFSSLNGATLIPISQVRMSLLNRINTATTIDEMMEQVRKMALEDIRFAPIYRRISKNDDLTKENQGFPNVKTMADVALVNSFWRTFKTANPVVKNLFILSNGDIVIGDSNFSTAARDIRFDYINAIKSVVRSNAKFFESKTTVNPDGKKIAAYYGKVDSPARLKIDTLDKRLALLEQLGIEFDKKKLEKLFENSPNDQVAFNNAVANIRTGINKADKFMSVDGKTLDVDGDLLKLAQVQAKIDNPEFSSTYYNVNGERVQTYIGTNAMSDLMDALNSITNLKELEGTKFAYLTTDSYSQNSYIIKTMFDTETGEKREINEETFDVGYADGLVNLSSGKNASSSRLKYSQRLLQEMNLNAKGFYLNLVPGDASMEHMVRMGLPVNFTDSELALTTDDIYKRTNEIFKGYFIDEFNLAKEDRRIVKGKGRDTSDLRFFKEILENFEKGLHDKIIKSTKSAEETYKDYKSKIEAAVNKYVTDEAERTAILLTNNGIIETLIEDGIPTDNFKMSIDIPGADDMTQFELDRAMLGFAANYMIANIELHKIMYSDPYQYKDELKRIKNFLSPRRPLMNGSAEMNAAMERVWNQGFQRGDTGFTDFMRDYFRSVSFADISSVQDLIDYNEEDDIFDETDGAGIIIYRAYRNYRIREGSWDMNSDELQYRHDVEYERLAKSGATKKELDEFEKNNPEIKTAYAPLKPIVAGNRFDEDSTYNDIVLDKFALYPISYRLAVKINEAALEPKETSNLLKMHDKMSEEDIDYAVYASGRKVGNYEGTTNDIYSSEGQLNTEPFHDVVNIPMSVISTQTDVPSKDTPLVTRGSQNTKLVTLDLMDAGVPIDYIPVGKGGKPLTESEKYEAWNNLETEEARFEASPLYKEIKTNENFLIDIIDNGYNELLNALGIVKIPGGWEMRYPERTAETLKSEMLKREVNKNISDALKGFEKGQVILEATPAYQQIRNILYSIADSHVISPKISGGMKVQVPSRLLEENKVIKKQVGKKEAYTSDVLDFYIDEDGKRVCQLMVARWFDSPMSDHDLLKYLNKTKEGQEILSGLAYRIPTQKQNSIDSFVIKQFLPKEFGDVVVVPAALVKKSGSDFDIDKLSMYLKSVFTNIEGKPEIFRYQGSEQATKDFYGNMFDVMIQSKESNILKQLLNLSLSEFDDPEYEAKLQNRLGKIDKRRINRDKFINNAYKSALQNGYIQSSQNLVSNKLNFERLIKPNSAEQLKKLSKEILKLRGLPEPDNATTGDMLSRGYMSKLRHDFVTGKYAIGIAAVAQTNHSLNQRSLMYLDLEMLKNVPLDDRPWLGDGEVRFKNVNRIQVGNRMVVSLSGIKNKVGEYISDILGQFIDGYVDIAKGAWIMDLGATPEVAGTYMFLVKIGVPIDTVAYFMNQPLIRTYLNTLQSENKSWLFNSSVLRDVLPDFDKNAVADIKEIPSNTKLKEYIKDGLNFNPKNQDNTNMQVFLLLEFLKYAKMSNHLYKVTQGTNFDTAAFSDPFMIFKKDEQLKIARQTIISSADKLLENSFLGKLSKRLNDVRNAMAQILISDRAKVRTVLEKVLLPYIDSNDRDFMKISQKAVNDLFDWAVQTNTNGSKKPWNESISRILIDNQANVAKHVIDFKKQVLADPEHALYNNEVIKLIAAADSSGRDNAVKNLKVKNKDNKIYDQNQIIFAFEELRDYLYGVPSIYGISGKDFYKNLVGLSVLQSGLSQSGISFTNLLPYNDFTAVYNEVLSTIDNLDGIEAFYDEAVLNRNNWNDTRFTPNVKARLIYSKKKGKYYYNMPMWFIGNNKDIQKAIDAKEIPQMLNVSVGSEGSHRDVIVYSWEEKMDKNWKVDKRIKKQMRKDGDYSYIKKGLFKKVYEDGDPVTYDSYNGRASYVYKMINAWGQASNANEFYTTGRQSVIDNGFSPVDEKTDKQVMDIINPVIEDRRINLKDMANSLSLLDLTDDDAIMSNDAFAEDDPRVVELDNKIKEAMDLVSSGKGTSETFKNIRKYHEERGKLVKELKYNNC
jgi:hypothetical protein